MSIYEAWDLFATIRHIGKYSGDQNLIHLTYKFELRDFVPTQTF